ncbi:MAG: ABC transporter substrate-binding protein, partial [Patescibacteria group bacterium]
KASKQSGGSIDYYDLIPFKKFNLGEPYIKKMTLYFYSNENDQISALEKGEVDQISSITPSNAQILKEENYRIESLTLPRVFGLFFNQNQNQIFTDKNIVIAIDLAINKDNIIRDVLLGYGVVINNPIPPNMINYQKLNKENNILYEEKINKAQDILNKDGWKKGADGFLQKTITGKNKKKIIIYLEFSISTGNVPELAKSAELIKQNLENIGMKVNVKTFEIGNLNQGVIRPRKYDALLFGQIINHESDLFAFWHSSQRKDPGLNVAMYTNAKVDKILEDAFITIDKEARIKKYAQFEDEIKKDMPAVFLYSPDFIYVISKNLQGFSLDHIITPGDRFLNSYLWYTETDNVWKIFSK